MVALETSLPRLHRSRICPKCDFGEVEEVPCVPLKERFLDLNKVAFCDGQEDEN